MVPIFKQLRCQMRMHSKWNLLNNSEKKHLKQTAINTLTSISINKSSYKFYTDSIPRDPTKGKEEKIESVKMPGFVHPETMNEEGYFTQRAKHQLEELKKRLDKPTVDNSEKKE